MNGAEASTRNAVSRGSPFKADQKEQGVMRVLHLCPLWHPVARDAHGGIETFLAGLVPQLQRLGCQVMLLASGDSDSDLSIIPAVPRSVCNEMAEGPASDYVHYEQHLLRLAVRYINDFDVVHSHVGASAYVLSAFPGAADRVLHTQHTPVLQDLRRFLALHPMTWISTVSEFQSRKLRSAGARRCQVIHNGIDFSTFDVHHSPGNGLLFVGRMEWEKGADAAIQVSRELDWPLTLAGPIVDSQYFTQRVQPFLNDRISYVGVIDHEQKRTLLGQAACTLLPFRGEEPFGLVSTESMACGTPVVALSNGALPEIVENGVTGYLARTENQLPALVQKAKSLDRSRVRSRAAARFDLASTAERYIRLYREMAAECTPCDEGSGVSLGGKALAGGGS
jgi:glycosyltransferase involved in cell wall biosynthesis